MNQELRIIYLSKCFFPQIRWIDSVEPSFALEKKWKLRIK